MATEGTPLPLGTLACLRVATWVPGDGADRLEALDFVVLPLRVIIIKHLGKLLFLMENPK